LGQGRENVKTFLTENPQLMAEVDERIREHLAAQNAVQADQASAGLPAEVDDLSLDDQPITLSE
jgi:hypothetical protein